MNWEEEFQEEFKKKMQKNQKHDFKPIVNDGFPDAFSPIECCTNCGANKYQVFDGVDIKDINGNIVGDVCNSDIAIVPEYKK